MPYGGRPSKGCFACRKRKIRCERLSEGCRQCLRAQIQCPGFRDEVDVIFHDQSTSVARKAKEKSLKNSKKRGDTLDSDESSDSVDIRTNDQPAEASLALPRSRAHTPPMNIGTMRFLPSLEEQAINIFYSNYVLEAAASTIGPTEGEKSLQSLANLEPNLLSSIKAVGFAALSNSNKAPELMGEARKNYVSAIRLTNEALESPEDSLKDSTLLAVMILCTFETTTGDNQGSMATWLKHVNGGATLIGLRGRKQLSTPMGRYLFLQMTANVLISCIQRQTALPPFLLDLRNEIAKYTDTSTQAWKVQDTIIAFTEFRARLKSGNSGNAREILSEALEIDRAFVDIFAIVPTAWEYETFYTESPSDFVFAGRYHVYRHYWTIQIWNAVRVCRILLNEVIRDELQKDFISYQPSFIGPEYAVQYQTAIRTLFHLRDDILASVHQHLTLVPGSKAWNWSPSPSEVLSNATPFEATTSTGTQTHASSSSHNLPILRTSGSYFLLWPLYLAGSMDPTDANVRNWVAQVLRHLGGLAGIQQAFVLAALMERQEEIAAWRT